MKCRPGGFVVVIALVGGCIDGTIGRVWDGGVDVTREVADGETQWWDHLDPQFCTSTSIVGIGASCSPSVACPSYLDCVYQPGCEAPHGTCQRWGYCTDSLNLVYGCSCAGMTVAGRTEPIESWGNGCPIGFDASACDIPVVPEDVTGDAIPPVDSSASGTCDPGYVYIPAGDYVIGSPSCAPSEGPQWTAVLSAFCMKRTEVTVAEFRACRTAGSCTTEPGTMGGWCNWNVDGRDNHPVNCVGWQQAFDYCAWSGGRLATEAEWEGAARGATWRLYPWGFTTPNDALANFNNNHGGTQEVALVGLDRCNNPFGLCDMEGNVFEWVNDWYGTYPSGRIVNPAGPSIGGHRVYRGAAFVDPSVLVPTSLRFHDIPTLNGIYGSAGFRCARGTR